MMNKKLNPVWQLISINYKEFLREPGILFWSLAFPVLMAWVLGIAFTKRAETVQSIACVTSPGIHTKLDTFLLGSERSVSSGRYFYRNTFSTKLGKNIFRLIPVSPDSAIVMLKRGETSLIIAEQGDSLVYRLDPQNTDARYNYLVLSAAIENKPADKTSGGVEVLSQQGTRYVDFLIPGLLALGIMNGFLWGIGYTLIEIRTKKLLRRMVAAPMKKWQFLFSHFFARISLSAFEAIVLYFFAWMYFRIQMSGSVTAFILVFISGSFCFAGIALLMGSRTSSSRVGNALINVITLPMMILSGIFFSYHNFPDVVIPVIRTLPLTLIADSLRSIMTEGAGIGESLPAVLILTAFGTICFILGLRIYKWY